jgi:hypothetical protein
VGIAQACRRASRVRKIRRQAAARARETAQLVITWRPSSI